MVGSDRVFRDRVALRKAKTGHVALVVLDHDRGFTPQIAQRVDELMRETDEWRPVPIRCAELIGIPADRRRRSNVAVEKAQLRVQPLRGIERLRYDWG